MVLVKTDMWLPRYGGRETVVDMPSRVMLTETWDPRLSFRDIMTDICMSVSCVLSYVQGRLFWKGNPAYPCRVIEMRHLVSDGGQRCCHIPSITGARRAVRRMSEVTGLTSTDQGRAWEQGKDTADLGCTWEQR